MGRKTRTVCSVILAALLMTGCGKNITGSIQEKMSEVQTEKAASDIASEAVTETAAAREEESDAADTDEAAESLFVSESGSVVPWQPVQISDGRVYLLDKGNIMSADEGSLSEPEYIYRNKGNDQLSIISFAVWKGNVYCTVDRSENFGDMGEPADTYFLALITSDGGLQKLLDLDGSKVVEVYEDHICLSGSAYEEDTGYNLVSFDTYPIEAEDELGEQDDYWADYEKLIPEGYGIVSVYFNGNESFYTIPFCLEHFGVIFAETKESDKIAMIDPKRQKAGDQPEKFVETNGGNVDALTGDGVIFTKYFDKTTDFQYTDFDDNLTSTLYTYENTDDYTIRSSFLLDCTDKAAVIGCMDAIDSSVYKTEAIPYSGDELEECDFVIDPANDAINNLRGDYFCDEIFKLSSEGICYVVSGGGDHHLCSRSLPDLSKETRADMPAWKSGLTEIGCTLSSENKDYTADDGTVIGTSEVTRPVFSATGDYPQSGADAVNKFYNDLIDSDLDSYATQMKQDYKDYSEDWMNYNEAWNDFECPYFNDEVMSLSILFSNYTGGAHGMYATYYHTFDRMTGKELKLSDILLTGSDEFKADVVNAIQEKTQGKDCLFVTPSEAVSNYSSMDDFNWCLKDDGIQVMFGVYEISSYAAGEQTVTVPYNELQFKSGYESIPDGNRRWD